MYAQTHIHCYLCENCAQSTAFGTENTILCILNVMKLQGVQLFAILEVEAP